MQGKLFLFDIDGTILNAHQVPRIAMRRVLLNRFDDFSYHGDFSFTGRTDWEIVEHLLAYAKVKVNITTKLIHDILKEFGLELEKEINRNTPPDLHPGIFDLVTALNQNPSAYLGLVTGNVAAGARSKLRATGLDQYFPVGAYGDDARERNFLPQIAIKRAEQYYQERIGRNNIWIIGDSIQDIICARVNQLRNLIVCTGWTSRPELELEKPEVIMDNLANTEKVLEILFE
jgi:phosphoglycolate phosphatase